MLFASAVMKLKHLPTTYFTVLPIQTKTETLLNKIKSINFSILEFSDAAVKKFSYLAISDPSYSPNTLILNSTINSIISTKKFDDSILTPG